MCEPSILDLDLDLPRTTEIIPTLLNDILYIYLRLEPSSLSWQ